MSNKLPNIIIAVLSASVIALGVMLYITSSNLKKYQQAQIKALRDEARLANDSAKIYLQKVEFELDGLKLSYDSMNQAMLLSQKRQQRQINAINKKYNEIYQHIDTVSIDSLLQLLTKQLSEVNDTTN